MAKLILNIHNCNKDYCIHTIEQWRNKNRKTQEEYLKDIIIQFLNENNSNTNENYEKICNSIKHLKKLFTIFDKNTFTMIAQKIIFENNSYTCLIQLWQGTEYENSLWNCSINNLNCYHASPNTVKATLDIYNCEQNDADIKFNIEQFLRNNDIYNDEIFEHLYKNIDIANCALNAIDKKTITAFGLRLCLENTDPELKLRPEYITDGVYPPPIIYLIKVWNK